MKHYFKVLYGRMRGYLVEIEYGKKSYRVKMLPRFKNKSEP